MTTTMMTTMMDKKAMTTMMMDKKAMDKKLRTSTCEFLQAAGMALDLPQLTIATAIVYFHRFFARHSIEKNDRFQIGTSCLFLAGKVEETPKKLRDVILVAHNVRNKKSEPLKVDSQEFNEIKECILKNEREILKTIAFNFTVDHPYKYLLSFIKTIKGTQGLAQVAWSFLNDSLRTTLCLTYRPQQIASSAVFLASKFLNYDLSSITLSSKPWYTFFGSTLQDIEDISNQVLDLYEPVPNLNAIKCTPALPSSDPDQTNEKENETNEKNKSLQAQKSTTPTTGSLSNHHHNHRHHPAQHHSHSHHSQNQPHPHHHIHPHTHLQPTNHQHLHLPQSQPKMLTSSSTSTTASTKTPTTSSSFHDNPKKVNPSKSVSHIVAGESAGRKQVSSGTGSCGDVIATNTTTITPIGGGNTNLTTGNGNSTNHPLAMRTNENKKDRRYHPY